MRGVFVESDILDLGVGAAKLIEYDRDAEGAGKTDPFIPSAKMGPRMTAKVKVCHITLGTHWPHTLAHHTGTSTMV